jgi:hypothetical protein
MTAHAGAEVLPGLWQFPAQHPEWTEEEGGEDGWEPLVSWWATSTSRGLLLIDPLVTDWEQLDRLVAHQETSGSQPSSPPSSSAAARYEAPVWAMRTVGVPDRQPLDHALTDRAELWDGIQAFFLERDDEIALWLPEPAALVFGDAMLRRGEGGLCVCPDSWTQPEGGSARLRVLLGELGRLPIQHVLVSHGPLVVGNGLESLQEAIE